MEKGTWRYMSSKRTWNPSSKTARFYNALATGPQINKYHLTEKSISDYKSIPLAPCWHHVASNLSSGVVLSQKHNQERPWLLKQLKKVQDWNPQLHLKLHQLQQKVNDLACTFDIIQNINLANEIAGKIYSKSCNK